VIEVKNPHHLSTGSTLTELDGALLQGCELELFDDGQVHQVTVTMQKPLSSGNE
jgi:hypothetical protein